MKNANYFTQCQAHATCSISICGSGNDNGKFSPCETESLISRYWVTPPNKFVSA